MCWKCQSVGSSTTKYTPATSMNIPQVFNDSQYIDSKRYNTRPSLHVALIWNVYTTPDQPHPETPKLKERDIHPAPTHHTSIHLYNPGTRNRRIHTMTPNLRSIAVRLPKPQTPT